MAMLTTRFPSFFFEDNHNFQGGRCQGLNPCEFKQESSSKNQRCAISKVYSWEVQEIRKGLIKAALSALGDALKDGFEDFKRIRTDPDLANLRETEEFESLLKKYDESFINENAINAIKSLFGFNKK